MLICTRAKRQTRLASPSKWIIAKQGLASHHLLKCSLAARKRALRSCKNSRNAPSFLKLCWRPVLHHRGRQFTEKSVHCVNMVKFSSCSNHWALFECYRSVLCISRVSFFFPFFLCVYMCVWLYLMQMRSKSCYFPLHSGHLFSTCCFVSHSFTSLQRKIWAFGVGGAVHKASLLQESHISSACVASGSLPYKRSSEITHTPSDARLRRLACCRAAKDVILRRKPE